MDETLLNIEAETIQLQEYIEKEFEFQLIGCSLDAGDIVLIPGYTQIIISIFGQYQFQIRRKRIL